jgi:hypothetical protein
VSKKKTPQPAPAKESPTPPDTATNPEPPAAPDIAIKPSNLKIGESEDQLRRRQEWFQKRSGKG